jgi:hypothetical protein
LLVINTDKAASRTLSIPVAGERYTLSSSDLQSKTIQLNGTELKLGAGDELPVLSGVPTQAGNVEFAPRDDHVCRAPASRKRSVSIGVSKYEARRALCRWSG